MDSSCTKMWKLLHEAIAHRGGVHRFEGGHAWRFTLIVKESGSHDLIISAKFGLQCSRVAALCFRLQVYDVTVVLPHWMPSPFHTSWYRKVIGNVRRDVDLFGKVTVSDEPIVQTQASSASHAMSVLYLCADLQVWRTGARDGSIGYF